MSNGSYLFFSGLNSGAAAFSIFTFSACFICYETAIELILLFIRSTDVLFIFSSDFLESLSLLVFSDSITLLFY